VKSKRPAVATATAAAAPTPTYAAPAPAQKQPQPSASAPGKINREDIAAIVDKFLAGRQPSSDNPERANAPEAEAGSMYAGPARQSESANQPANGGRSSAPAPVKAAASSNGAKAVDFVSEDDVRRAIQKGEKIYINAKTIITPAARDIGEPAEIFAKT
jgi:hypothetical protein